MKPASRLQRQSGAALITVLMIVAAMSVAGIGISQAVLAATQRAKSMDAQAQIRQFSAAAEGVVVTRLTPLIEQIDYQLTLESPGLSTPTVFPIENGEIQIVPVDATNCFNLNTLVQGQVGINRRGNEDAISELRTLFSVRAFDQLNTDSLIASLVDWMDDDQVPGPGGAEDAYYSTELPAYRTAGQPMVSVSELRAIRGFTPDVLEVVTPLFCARPTSENPTPQALNINTLKEEQAALLIPAFSGALTLEDARNVLLSRPRGGWRDMADFLAEPGLQRIAPELRLLERLDTASTHLEVQANISYRDQTVRFRYLVLIARGQTPKVLSRERVI